jgi:hypothetical protein
VKLPRGFSTWEVPGGRLVVLSSLAPQCAGKLIREPVWARPGRPRPGPGRAPRVEVLPPPELPALPAPAAEPRKEEES